MKRDRKSGQLTKQLLAQGQNRQAAFNAAKQVGKGLLRGAAETLPENLTFAALSHESPTLKIAKRDLAGDFLGNLVFNAGQEALGQVKLSSEGKKILKANFDQFASKEAKSAFDRLQRGYSTVLTSGKSPTRIETPQQKVQRLKDTQTVQSEAQRIYTKEQKNLIGALKSEGIEQPVSFGKLSDKKLSQINQLRAKNNLPPIQDGNLLIHPKVIEKLKEKRINLGKMSADQVADVLYSATYNNDSKVFSTEFPHIQALAKFNSNGKTANTAYIGEHAKKGSIKSAYINDIADINKQALEGGGYPSSVRQNDLTRSSTNVSAFQSNVNRPIVPQDTPKVNQADYKTLKELEEGYMEGLVKSPLDSIQSV